MMHYLTRSLIFMVAMLFTVMVKGQDWPNRPIRMIVPGAAGASADALARSIAEVLGRQLGVAVVVENKVGASGVLGADFVAKAHLVRLGHKIVLQSDKLVIPRTLVRLELAHFALRLFLVFVSCGAEEIDLQGWGRRRLAAHRLPHLVDLALEQAGHGLRLAFSIFREFTARRSVGSVSARL